MHICDHSEGSVERNFDMIENREEYYISTSFGKKATYFDIHKLDEIKFRGKTGYEAIDTRQAMVADGLDGDSAIQYYSIGDTGFLVYERHDAKENEYTHELVNIFKIKKESTAQEKT